MTELEGWLLDTYPGPEGMILWLLGKDGLRHRLTQSLPVTFYAAGPPGMLRSLWHFLQAEPYKITLTRQERRDLFEDRPVVVLAIAMQSPTEQEELFRQVSQRFPDLVYYDADILAPLRHAAVYRTFPLAFCHIRASPGGRVEALEALDTPWDLDPDPPPLRILTIRPDQDPRHAAPAALDLHYGRWSAHLALEPARPLLINLAAILRQYDPDIVLTAWGDGWLFPRLLDLSDKLRIPLPLSRDSGRGVLRKSERSYASYGQVMYRNQQVHFFGRLHVDSHNAMLYHDYGLDGIFELSRVTALPIQLATRLSPGAGISAMQVITALRNQIMVPWHKQQAEEMKTAWQLLHADQGGLVYQPTVGLHERVAELDFISMYPSIMVRCNISPETVPGKAPESQLPGDPLEEEEEAKTLIPQTLGPLLKKRVALKRLIPDLSRSNPRKTRYKAQASAHKWLLVTCFGYLGYKNSKFGRIEAHEAVSAYGREALLRAKEAAEDHGYEILHLYVDGVWARRDGPLTAQDVQPLLEEIEARTGLPIALDGIYRWVAFVASRQNATVPVANRYFGVFEDGTIKARGIEARRRDTPLWVAETQTAGLERLAREPDLASARRAVADVIDMLRGQVKRLCAGQVPLKSLVVAQKVSRSLDEYRTPSLAARAATQLAGEGKTTRPGQMVSFLHLTGSPGVHAWDLATPPDPARIDIDRYCALLLRAAATLLQPFGLDEPALRRQLFLMPQPSPLLKRNIQLSLLPRHSG